RRRRGRVGDRRVVARPSACCCAARGRAAARCLGRGGRRGRGRRAGYRRVVPLGALLPLLALGPRLLGLGLGRAQLALQLLDACLQVLLGRRPGHGDLLSLEGGQAIMPARSGQRRRFAPGRVKASVTWLGSVPAATSAIVVCSSTSRSATRVASQTSRSAVVGCG